MKVINGMMKRNAIKNIKAPIYILIGTLFSYVVLTLLAAAFGLSSGTVQFRISEALCILPLFFPEAIPGLFIGCLISNLLANGAPWDIVLGSLATLIGAFGTRLMVNIPEKLKWLATIPTILSNMIIIPFVLIYVYGLDDLYFVHMAWVGLGEVVCAGIGGSALYYLMKKHEKQWLM